MRVTEYPVVKILDKFGRHSYKTKELLLFLINKYGVCYWCEKPVRYYPPVNNVPELTPDAATIDHIKSRYFRKKGEIVPKVLSCYLCNYNRSREERKKFGNRPKTNPLIG